MLNRTSDLCLAWKVENYTVSDDVAPFSMFCYDFALASLPFAES